MTRQTTECNCKKNPIIPQINSIQPEQIKPTVDPIDLGFIDSYDTPTP